MPYLRVMARATPQLKELVVKAVQAQKQAQKRPWTTGDVAMGEGDVGAADPGAGAVVLMCGDGGNDVGALRQAATGVALMGEEVEGNGDDNETAKGNATTTLPPPPPASLLAPATPASPSGLSSVAPFTVRSNPPKLSALLGVLRHGRCAQVSKRWQPRSTYVSARLLPTRPT